METVSIALACTMLGSLISYLTFQRNKNKDIRAETTEDAYTKAKLMQYLFFPYFFQPPLYT